MTRHFVGRREPVWKAIIILSSCMVAAGFINDLLQLWRSMAEESMIQMAGSSLIAAALWTILWFAVYYAIMALWIYRDAYRIFGRISAETREQMSEMTSISRMNKTTYGGGLILTYAGIIGLIAFFIFTDFRLLFIVLLAVIIHIWLYLRTHMPPFIVYLSSSDPRSLQNHWKFKRFVSPLRVITLLDVEHGVTKNNTEELHLDCLRTTNDNDWWEVILMLLNLSPIIIIDTSAITSGVLREADHIVSNSLAYKCIFLESHEGDSDLLSKIGMSPSEINDLCLLNESRTLDILDKILLKAVLPAIQRPLNEFDID